MQWEKIVKLAESIRFRDKKTAEFVKVSSKYGLQLYRIYRSIFYLSAIDKNLYRTTELKKWIDEYDTAWADYQLLAKQNANCQTLYSKEKALRMPLGPADKEVSRLRKSVEN